MQLHYKLKMMLRDANEAGNDGMLLEYYTMDDIDIPTLERFRQMFQTLHPEHQWNSSEHKEFLTNLEVILKTEGQERKA